MSNDATPVTEAAPVRRRASRRVTAAAGEAVAVPVAAEAEAEPSAPAADASAQAAEEAAPKKRVSRARKKAETTDQTDEASTSLESASAEPVSAEPVSAEPVSAEPATEAAQTEQQSDAKAKGATKAEPKRATRASSRSKKVEAAPEAADAAESADAAPAAKNGEAPKQAAEDAAESAAGDGGEAGAETPSRRRNTRSRGRKAATNGDAAADAAQSDTASSGDAEGEQSEQNGAAQQNGRSEGNTRSSRTRQRERKRRGGNDDEPELTEDDVLLPIAGILDVLDNYAFVRTSGYLPGTGDVYVSLGQVKKYGLRKGDAVVGAIRQPRDGEGGGRQKYNAIVKVDSVNSKPINEEQKRADFADLTPIYATERLRLETSAEQLSTRVVDLFAPIGKGQRGLIIGPHESGKSSTVQAVAQAVAQNQPDAHLMMVLIDERPEEVTELQRTMNGEVIASTFDRPAEDHTTIAELAIERAKRLVELGHDVVVLIDSLTDLARAYNLAAPAAARVPAGSLDAAAVFPVKRLLSAARNIENGGSLTIIATLSAQPGSHLDDALIGELEGVANMQLRLSGEAADLRVFPAVDVLRSSTRNVAQLTSEAETRVMDQLRRSLQGKGGLEAIEGVLHDISRTSSNVEFLAQAQRAQG